MIKHYWKYAAAALLAAFLVWSIIGRGQGCKSGKIEQHEAQANEAKGAANAHKTESVKTEAAVEARKPVLVSDSAKIEKLRAELAALRAGGVRGPVPPPSPPEVVTPVDVCPDPGPDLAGLVLKQDELIQAQARSIKNLNDQVNDLGTLADHWRKAHDARAMEAASLRLAMDAQKSAAKASVWKTRIGSFTVGLGTGALVGAFASRR